MTNDRKSQHPTLGNVAELRDNFVNVNCTMNVKGTSTTSAVPDKQEATGDLTLLDPSTTVSPSSEQSVPKKRQVSAVPEFKSSKKSVQKDLMLAEPTTDKVRKDLQSSSLNTTRKSADKSGNCEQAVNKTTDKIPKVLGNDKSIPNTSSSYFSSTMELVVRFYRLLLGFVCKARNWLRQTSIRVCFNLLKVKVTAIQALDVILPPIWQQWSAYREKALGYHEGISERDVSTGSSSPIDSNHRQDVTENKDRLNLGGVLTSVAVTTFIRLPLLIYLRFYCFLVLKALTLVDQWILPLVLAVVVCFGVMRPRDKSANLNKGTPDKSTTRPITCLHIAKHIGQSELFLKLKQRSDGAGLKQYVDKFTSANWLNLARNYFQELGVITFQNTSEKKSF